MQVFTNVRSLGSQLFLNGSHPGSKIHFKQLGLKSLLLFAAFVISISNATAQTYKEWTGSGTNWSTSSNWNTPGIAYAQLEWKGNGLASSINDISGTQSQWRLFFTGAKAYTLSGNAIDFFDFGTNNSWVLSQSTVAQTVNNNLSFKDNSGGTKTAWITTQNSGTLTLGGSVDIAGGVTELRIAGSNTSGTITLNGVLSNSTSGKPIAIGKDETGAAQINTRVFFGNSSNTYNGVTTIVGGTLFIAANGALGTGSLTLGNGTNTTTLAVTGTTTRTQIINVTDVSTAAVIDVASSQTFTLSGNLTGGATNSTKYGKAGAGILFISGASNTYNGQIQIGDGTVVVQSSLGTNTSTSNRGVDLGLNVGDVSTTNNVALQATNGVTVGQSIYVSSNASSATRTISLNGTGAAIFNNEIYTDGDLTLSGGSGTITLSGNIVSPASNKGIIVTGGTVVLSGNNTYTGTTTVNGGTLQLGAADRIANASNIILGGGTFSTGAVTGNNETVGTLNLTASTASTIALGTGSHTLTFANSSSLTPWGTGASLTITGWAGIAGQSNTSGGRIFVSSATGLTAAQLAKISFQGYLGTPIILSTGEVVPHAPVLSITAGALSHGSSCVGTPSSSITYTITNTGGTATSSVSVSSTNPAEFAVSGLSSTTIAGNGGTATYVVTFTPNATGSRSATINVSSSTPNSTNTSNNLTGTGNATTVITVPASPATQTKFINSTATNLTLTATGTAISYQWYSNASNSNTGGTSLAPAGQSASYTPATSTLGTKYYYCVVSGTCGTATSAALEVVVTNSNTWAGGGNNNWSTGSNWTSGLAPTSTNDAVIPFGNTPYPVLSTSSAINDLIIDNGATVGIGAGNTFTITGAVTGTGTISGSATSNLVTTGNTGILFTSGANTLKNLAVNSGTLTLGNALNITGGTAINTYGTVTVASGATLASAGNLTIRSNEFGTARVAAGAAAGNYITGDVTVERYIPANAKRAWRLLSVPTKGTKTIKQTWQENQAPNANSLPGFGTIITGFQPTLAQVQAAGFDAYTQTASIQLYNGSTYAWDYLSSTNSSPIETNRGYFVYIRGDRSQTVDVATTSVTATTLRTTGTLYQGDGSAALTIPASKYMAVGNTFASAIDFTALSKTGTLSNTFYVWDAKLLSGTSLGAYQTFSLATGYTPATPGGSYPSGTPNTTIESGEAIMMTAPAGGGGTVKLVEASKTTGNQVNPFRPAARPAQFRTSLYKSGTVLADNNIVVFDNAYANGVDVDDALKLAHGGENIDIVNSNQSLIVDARKPVESTDVINYSLKNLSAQQYKLEFSTINMNTAGLTAFVEDKYLHTTTAINLDATSEYTFVVDGSNAASKAADRISVVFKKVGVLPVSNVKAAITVFPNPVEGNTANLQFNNQPKGRYSINLLNGAGSIIFTTFAEYAGGTGVNLVTLPANIASGNYQLEIISPNKTKQVQTLLINTTK